MMLPPEVAKGQESVGDGAEEVTELIISEQIGNKDAPNTRRER
jgi:hypothetical protein